MPDTIHGLVWSDPSGRSLPSPRGGPVGRFPMLSRLADPYQNATIHPGEVAVFRHEVTCVLEALGPSSAAYTHLERVLAVCQTAERHGWFLFCHGD